MILFTKKLWFQWLSFLEEQFRKCTGNFSAVARVFLILHGWFSFVHTWNTVDYNLAWVPLVRASFIFQMFLLHFLLSKNWNSSTRKLLDHDVSTQLTFTCIAAFEQVIVSWQGAFRSNLFSKVIAWRNISMFCFKEILKNQNCLMLAVSQLSTLKIVKISKMHTSRVTINHCTKNDLFH